MSRLRLARAGSAAIEFALCLPVIVVVLAGITDVSLYLSAIYNIERACRDAARVGSATVDGTAPIGDDIEAAACAHVVDVLTNVALDPTLATTTANWALESDGYYYLTVSVEYPFEAPFGIFPSVDDGLEAHFTMMTLTQI